MQLCRYHRENLFQTAEWGDARSQHLLRIAFINGNGVERDLHQALHWLERSAHQGGLEAQYNAAVLLMNGQGGVNKDPIGAYTWFTIAARLGARLKAKGFVAQILEAREVVEAELSENEIDYALARASLWQPVSENRNLALMENLKKELAAERAANEKAQ